jgi:hypothetical protein
MKVKMILQLRVQLFLSLWQIVGSKKKTGNSRVLLPQKHKFTILKQEVFHIWVLIMSLKVPLVQLLRPKYKHLLLMLSVMIRTSEAWPSRETLAL